MSVNKMMTNIKRIEIIICCPVLALLRLKGHRAFRP